MNDAIFYAVMADSLVLGGFLGFFYGLSRLRNPADDAPIYLLVVTMLGSLLLTAFSCALFGIWIGVPMLWHLNVQAFGL